MYNKPRRLTNSSNYLYNSSVESIKTDSSVESIKTDSSVESIKTLFLQVLLLIIP